MKDTGEQWTAEKAVQYSRKSSAVRHALDMQLPAVANAVAAAIITVVALYAVFIIAVAALFMSGV
jgi:hypothetical protein